MCAIDALGIPLMTGTDGVIDSADPDTGTPIRIQRRGERWTWQPATAVVVIGHTDCCGTLAYLDKADAWDYSVEAARAGAARSYVYDDRPAQRAGEIQAAEEQARQAGAGLWGPPCFGRVEATPVPR